MKPLVRIAFLALGMITTILAAFSQHHNFACADYTTRKVIIIEKDSVVWQHAAPNSNDLWVLPNGNLLFTTGNEVLASSNQYKLSWSDNSNNEDQFRIEVFTDGKTWQNYTTASTNATRYTTTDLLRNKTYYFRVRAENVTGNSDYFNLINLTAS